jgi:hypothetical protein
MSATTTATKSVRDFLGGGGGGGGNDAAKRSLRAKFSFIMFFLPSVMISRVVFLNIVNVKY